jgi:hypothetical protein
MRRHATEVAELNAVILICGFVLEMIEGFSCSGRYLHCCLCQVQSYRTGIRGIDTVKAEKFLLPPDPSVSVGQTDKVCHE